MKKYTLELNEFQLFLIERALSAMEGTMDDDDIETIESITPLIDAINSEIEHENNKDLDWFDYFYKSELVGCDTDLNDFDFSENT